MNIPKNAFVLEVGSGNNPNPRSDILVDRYLFDNGQRAGGFRIFVDRPLVVADGYRLPFKDKAFDYVICSHILEHLPDPKKFIIEMTRIGKAGYIEVPSAVSERIFGWNFHLWYCAMRGKTLELTKKKDGERFGGFFHRLIANQTWFRRFFEEYENDMYIKLEWKRTVSLRVVRKNPSASAFLSLDRQTNKILSTARPDASLDTVFAFQFFLRRAMRKMRKAVRRISWVVTKTRKRDFLAGFITSFCVCPSCAGVLQRIGRALKCSTCGTTYPMIGIIPILLVPKERKKGY